MKGVLGWIKSHLLIVISTIVIVASLPVAWVFSSGWNEDIRTELEKSTNDAHNKIRGAKVTYVIPSLLPGEDSVSESRPPNRVVTEFFRTRREQRTAQASGVVDEVLRFNRGSHGLLEPRLLPEPEHPQRETSLKYAMLAQVAGDEQLGTESVYHDLYSRIGAGGPPDPIKLSTTIQDLRDRESERLLAESGTGSLTPEQEEALNTMLSDRRIAETQRRAKEISVYGGIASFDPEGFGEETSQIPPTTRNERGSSVAPSLSEAFGWNFDYWVVSDVLSAIDAANTDSGGTRANVERAAVKRIERLSVRALPIDEVPDESDDDAGTGEATDPRVSVTGRVSTADFDVVRVKLTLVIDAEQLPGLFEAFAETNLMTVLDLDLHDVDVWEDLRQGYSYGNGPVMRASLEIETIWLREWTVPMMPDTVKEALGVVTEDEFGDEG